MILENISTTPSALPAPVTGKWSPYPTVVNVTTAHQIPSAGDLNSSLSGARSKIRMTLPEIRTTITISATIQNSLFLNNDLAWCFSCLNDINESRSDDWNN
jgi:hypothetical protein